MHLRQFLPWKKSYKRQQPAHIIDPAGAEAARLQGLLYTHLTALRQLLGDAVGPEAADELADVLFRANVSTKTKQALLHALNLRYDTNRARPLSHARTNCPDCGAILDVASKLIFVKHVT